MPESALCTKYFRMNGWKRGIFCKMKTTLVAATTFHTAFFGALASAMGWKMVTKSLLTFARTVIGNALKKL